MGWGSVELEPEVRDWLGELNTAQFATAAFYIDLLADEGVHLSEPHTRQLDGKLRELRFYLDGNAVRVIYWIARGAIYLDRNGNGWMDSEGEGLAGVSFSLADAKTGAVAATATTDETGYASFVNVPRGRYKAVVNGPYQVKSDWYFNLRMSGWTVEVVPV